MIYNCDATGVVCDDELSPAQLNNLERELECKVMDRTMVILDIFAGRAKTSEGKIQVELAQLKYRAARLVGMRASVPSWRRNRNERSGREKTGNGPSIDSCPDQSVERTVGRSAKASGIDSKPARKKQNESGCYCGIYQCGKIYTAECAYRGGSIGRG